MLRGRRGGGTRRYRAVVILGFKQGLLTFHPMCALKSLENASVCGELCCYAGPPGNDRDHAVALTTSAAPPRSELRYMVSIQHHMMEWLGASYTSNQVRPGSRGILWHRTRIAFNEAEIKCWQSIDVRAASQHSFGKADDSTQMVT